MLTNARWNVRIVRNGEHYGLRDCLTYEKEGEYGPLVEFYDMTARPDIWGDRGYFVSRYYLSTLLTNWKEKLGRGMCLHGGGKYDPRIDIEPEAYDAILNMLVRLPKSTIYRENHELISN